MKSIDSIFNLKYLRQLEVKLRQLVWKKLKGFKNWIWFWKQVWHAQVQGGVFLWKAPPENYYNRSVCLILINLKGGCWKNPLLDPRTYIYWSSKIDQQRVLNMFEDMFKQAMITLQEMAVRTKQRAITGNILYAPFATNLRFFLI